MNEGPYFFVKILDTLFQHPHGLKGSGASADNTLLFDDSHKNVRNNIWNAIHPSSYQSLNEPTWTAWFWHQLISWLCHLRHSGQTVPRFCEANQGFS